MIRFLIGCSLFLSAVLTARADQIVLKNGDRVTGQIVKSAGKKLIVKTEFMGAVEIAWDAVERLASDQPVYLTLNDNQTVVGVVSAAGEPYEVQTKETGKVKLAKTAISAIRNEAEYKTWQAEVEWFRVDDGVAANVCEVSEREKQVSPHHSISRVLSLE